MHDYGGWMWLFIDVVLVAILAVALIYGTAMWRRRYRDPATQQARDDATRRAFRQQ
jgi:heme exporter protein D